MKDRAVNVAILLLLILELASGMGSFLVGEPDGRWMFWLHRAGGLALVMLLVWKVNIVARSYRRRSLRVSIRLAAVGGLLFLESLATGCCGPSWCCRTFPVPVFGSWTVLSLHVALSLTLIPLLLVHVGLRWPRPNRADLLGRRAARLMLGLLAASFTVWGVQEFLSTLVAPSASRRRFTGSSERASYADNAHPVTNWLSDPIPRIPPEGWRLRVHGEVGREDILSYG